MDHVVKIGLADPDRLGIGGWSYGGILTNYAIATDSRFKAAISGAGSSNQISMYGTDMYIQQYEAELGPPWKAQDLWLKLSYPFFHADRIRTPTLFLAGEKDFNVPLLGSEQMYQALRSLGVDSKLVIYPGQFHGITTPSYKKDRLERYLEWYREYLLAPPSTTSAGSDRPGDRSSSPLRLVAVGAEHVLPDGDVIGRQVPDRRGRWRSRCLLAVSPARCPSTAPRCSSDVTCGLCPGFGARVGHMVLWWRGEPSRLRSRAVCVCDYNRPDMEQTLAIIKPDAVAARYTGRIIQRIEEAGFQIRAMRLVQLSLPEAEGFYAVHRQRPFFGSLTTFMASGPVVVMALEAEDAIRKWRTLMGATDPSKAEAGTLRKEFGASIENNATHGSDAPENGGVRARVFFPGPGTGPVIGQAG